MTTKTKGRNGGYRATQESFCNRKYTPAKIILNCNRKLVLFGQCACYSLPVLTISEVAR